jgi:tRNA-dihydrouridine synthase B
MLRIGDLKLSSNLILAPMSGVSDLPFRLINRKFGCELAFVEMINVRCLGHKSHKTQTMLSANINDRPLGVQLLGSKLEFILRAIEIINRYDFDVLDFNAACPEKKVTRRAEGASLLKEPKKLSNLLKTIVKNSSFPVTVKIRSGWDKNSVNAKEVALYARDAGIKALFIHGRTKVQGYSGNVDYDIIREVKEVLEIPVIASGDILSAELAQKMFDETGCDGVIIARGALGNPWIFKEIEQFFKNNKILPRPSIKEVINTMLEHLSLCVDFHGPRRGVIIFRKFFMWYTKGFRRIRPLREKVCRAKTKDDMTALIGEVNRSVRFTSYKLIQRPHSTKYVL